MHCNNMSSQHHDRAGSDQAKPSLATLKKDVKSKSVNKPGHVVSSLVSINGYMVAGSSGIDDVDG